MLHYVTLVILCYIMLFSAMLCYIRLGCFTIRYIALRYVEIHYITVNVITLWKNYCFKNQVLKFNCQETRNLAIVHKIRKKDL